MQQPRRSSLGSEPNGPEKRRALHQAPLVTTKARIFVRSCSRPPARKKKGSSLICGISSGLTAATANLVLPGIKRQEGDRGPRAILFPGWEAGKDMRSGRTGRGSSGHSWCVIRLDADARAAALLQRLWRSTPRRSTTARSGASVTCRCSNIASNWWCRGCGWPVPRCGPKLERLAWLDAYARVTRPAGRLGRRAVCQVLRSCTWRGTSGSTGRRSRSWIGPICSAHSARSISTGIEVIALDEFAIQKGHRYATVVIDPTRKRVLWVGRGRGREDVRPFFELLGPERCRGCGRR